MIGLRPGLAALLAAVVITATLPAEPASVARAADPDVDVAPAVVAERTSARTESAAQQTPPIPADSATAILPGSVNATSLNLSATYDVQLKLSYARGTISAVSTMTTSSNVIVPYGIPDVGPTYCGASRPSPAAVSSR